jgi:hypothetical protein
MRRWAPALLILVAAAIPLAARAQAPPRSPEADEIAACLCLQQALDASRADMNGRRQAYLTAQSEVAQIDAQLQSERARMDVNNPQAVAQFRQLLERRDAAFRRSSALAGDDLHGATERYSAHANEFNARCANRPRNPDLLRAVEATLTCPRPY